MTGRAFRAAAFAVSLLAAGAFAAGPAQAEAPAPDPSVAAFEADFLTNMIDHHAMAVQMAQVCLERAVHPELRSMCQSIVSSQSSEITQMQQWLQDWYGRSHEPVMGPEHAEMMGRLDSATGAQFDEVFMEMMIEHHATAVAEGLTCLRTAYHSQLRRLCMNIVSSQTREIVQMEVWLCRWYGDCSFAWAPNMSRAA